MIMAIDVAAAPKTLQRTPVPQLRQRYAEVFGEVEVSMTDLPVT
jgi:hypothetical protein